MTDQKYFEPHGCPVCGKHDFPKHGTYDVCPVCGWQDDPVQEKYDDYGGINLYSLKEYREKYEAGEIDLSWMNS